MCNERRGGGVLAVLLGVCLALSAAGANAATDPLDLPLPKVSSLPGIQTAWVARRMMQNGIPTSVQSFKARMPIDKVLERYRRWLLRNGAQHAVFEQAGDVSTLGAGMGPFFVNIQGGDKPGYRSAGFIVVSLMPGIAPTSRQTSLPVPESARVFSVQRYDDGGRGGESVTLVSDRPVSVMVDALAAGFEDAGWSRLDEYSEADTGDTRLMMFKRGNELAQVTVQRNRRRAAGGALMLINRSEER